MSNENFSDSYVKVGKQIVSFVATLLIGHGRLVSCVEKDSEALVPDGREHLPGY
jgi:hypothetical protein